MTLPLAPVEMRRSLPSIFLLSLLGLIGCEPTCQTCGQLYDSAILRMLGDVNRDVEGVLFGAVDPVEAADELVVGQDDEGYDWSLVGVSGGLMVGVPSLDLVRGYAQRAGDGELVVQSLYESPVGNDRFGSSIAENNGWMFIGAPAHDVGVSGTAAGAVYVYNTEGLQATLYGNTAEQRLGTHVFACGDVDGGGVADWVVYAAGDQEIDGTVAPLAGAAYFLSSEVLLAEVDANGPDIDIARFSPLGGLAAEDATGAQFGATVACKDSLGGTSEPELVVGAPYATARGDTVLTGAGQVLIWKGGVDLNIATPDVVLMGDEADGYFGDTVATGDLDNDGNADLVVGAPGRDHRSDLGTSRDMAGGLDVFLSTTLTANLTPSLRLALRYDQVNGTIDDQLGSVLQIAEVDNQAGAEIVVGAPAWEPVSCDNPPCDEESVATRNAAVQVGAIYIISWQTVAQTALSLPFGITSDRYLDELDTFTLAGDTSYLTTGARFALTDIRNDGGMDLFVLNRQQDN